MDNKQITNAEFLTNIFRGLAQDEYLWTTAFSGSPDSNASWTGRRDKSESCSDYPHGNAYFSVAAFRGGNARIKENFSRLFCVVLDDAANFSIEPSWCLRTSEEKVQLGFILDEPITDIGIATRLHQALTKGGRIASDKNGNNPVRYVRLPIGINTKYEPAYCCSLERFNPDLRYSLSELIDVLGLSESEVMFEPSKDLVQTGQANDANRVPDSEYIAHIVNGENYHESILKLTARYASQGMAQKGISELMKGLMSNAPDKGTDRWQNRYDDIDRTIIGAIRKFGDQAAYSNQPLLLPYDYEVSELRPVEFVIDGFISTGISMIAGEPGVGKSSMLVPLACCAAHLCPEDDPLKPSIRRKVFYVTEDTEQVERILYGLHKHVVTNLSTNEFKEWFFVVNAKRLPSSNLANEVKRIKNEYLSQMNGFNARPLIVLDTANATLDIDNENDNAEVGRAIAEIKQAAEGMPIWIVAHTPKTINRQEVKDFTVRGASAFTGDTQATLFIFKEKEKDSPDSRVMMLGKHRFVEEFDEICFSTELYHQTIHTPWGTAQTQKYLVGKPEPASSKARMEKKEALKKDREAGEESALRLEILQAIGNPSEGMAMTRERLKGLVRKNHTKMIDLLDKLIFEGKVIEAVAESNGKRGRKARLLKLPNVVAVEPESISQAHQHCPENTDIDFCAKDCQEIAEFELPPTQNEALQLAQQSGM